MLRHAQNAKLPLALLSAPVAHICSVQRFRAILSGHPADEGVEQDRSVIHLRIESKVGMASNA